MIASAGWHRAEGYIQSVLDKDFPVCKAVQGVIDRHVRDMETPASAEFPYYFDVDKANTYIDCFELLLCHSKGDFAGMPFILEPWQAFGVGALFGWLRVDDNTRRFRELWWTMGRKNGKSAILSGLAIIMAGLDINPTTGKPEAVAEVVLAATKKEQALQVNMSEIERMRMQSPVIKSQSKVTYRQLIFNHNQGQIHAVGSDKSYDGLSPSFIAVDELHQYQEHQRSFWDTMVTASGSRSQALIGVFTTAGTDKSHLYLSQYRRAKQTAVAELIDNRMLPLIYELDEDDDPLDEANWIKANPNLGISLRKSFLEAQAAKAATCKTELNQFTRYHMNRIVTAVDKAFELADWDRCQGQLSDWSEADAVGAGVDLGGRDDLGAYGLCARFPTDETDEEGNPLDRYELQFSTYIAQDTNRDLALEPFATWVDQEQIHVRRFPITELKNDLVRDLVRYYVTDTAYDPAGAQQFAEGIESEGHRIASMAQSYRHFSEPIGEFQRAMADGRITHTGDDFLRWSLSNCCTIQDRQGRVMLDKRSSNEKIDVIVAIIMAFARCCAAPRRSTGPLFIQ